MLTAYNCSGVRKCQQWEIDFLQHLANQMAIAIEQSQLYRQLAIANQKLHQLATTDGLAGIANRREFDRVFTLEWRRLAREQLPLSLIMFDINFFKLYNQFYGHVGGDDCLRWRCWGDRHNCQVGWGFGRPLRRRRICCSAGQN
jgi:GAF domain-containing protein